MSKRRERIRQRTAAVWNDTKYASVGLEFGISIALCCWVGRWAQERWDFAPWGILLGVTLGFASGLRRLVKIAAAESHQFPLPPESSLSESEHAHDSDSDSI